MLGKVGKEEKNKTNGDKDSRDYPETHGYLRLRPFKSFKMVMDGSGVEDLLISEPFAYRLDNDRDRLPY